MVIWLMGLSGAGKTTLGLKLEKYLKNKKISCDIIDGNIVRDFFDNDIGYTLEERIMNMKRIILAAYYLEKNDVIPIVCNISPFKEMRNFARKKFKDYIEVYLEKPFEIASKQNSKKHVYNQKHTPIIGKDIPFEIPENYDLKVQTYKETVEESFNKIISYLNERRI